LSDICIEGGIRLKGEIKIQGSKNAVLPILAASVLHPGITVLESVPLIRDVWASVEIIEFLGGKVSVTGDQMEIDTRFLTSKEIPKRLGERMRSSVLFLGAMLARFGEAALYRPGGCAIGSRPVDLHLRGLESLGVMFLPDDSRIHAQISRWQGGEVHLTYPSVGATEQLLLAAAGNGEITRIYGAAREPEIVTLCEFLVQTGILQMEGIGTGTLVMCGGRESRDSCFRIPGDRIAAGTYLAAAALTRGEVQLHQISASHMTSTLKAFQKMGCSVGTGDQWIQLKGPSRLKNLPFLATNPFPEFPTDMQSAFLVMMTVADGHSVMEENVFEDRLAMAESLRDMGADIQVQGRRAFCRGVSRLRGAKVSGTDLRCGAALVLAGLNADGQTIVNNYEYVLRGYEGFDQQLRELGASVTCFV